MDTLRVRMCVDLLMGDPQATGCAWRHAAHKVAILGAEPANEWQQFGPYRIRHWPDLQIMRMEDERTKACRMLKYGTEKQPVAVFQLEGELNGPHEWRLVFSASPIYQKGLVLTPEW